MLSQTVAVSAGKIYQLMIQAPWTPASNDDPAKLPVQQRARLELRWLDGAAQPLGSLLTLPLDIRRFSVVAWSSVAPSGANRAEVRLIQPRGRGNLIVESVSLTQIDQVDVPLIFLAETPGELKLSNLRVTYDLPEEQDLLDAFTSQLASDAPIVRPPIVRPISPTTTLPPITAIGGIGEARARGLAALGLGTIDKLAAADPEAIAQALSGVTLKLAAADPEAIAQALSGVTLKMASDFVDEAQRILAGGHA